MRSDIPIYVYYNSEKLGTINDDDKRYFLYSATASKRLSLSFPQDDVISYPEAFDFLQNFLPEGMRYHKLCNMFRGQSMRCLVSKIGGDLPGALSFLESDSYREGKEYTDVTDTLFAIPEQCVPSLNLAGAQNKVSLVYKDSRFFISFDQALSTHIFKPESTEHPGLARNECLCLDLARQYGFDVPDYQLIQRDGKEGLLLTRFDRKVIRDTITRIHQEDFCQIGGIPASKKYQYYAILHEYIAEGMIFFAKLLKEHGCNCAEELAKRCVFSFFIGNTDAHAKNFAVLYKEDGLALAPFYDIVCILAQGRYEPSLAMEIGEKADIADIHEENMALFAEQIEVPGLVAYAEELCKSLPERLNATIARHSKLYGEHPIYEKIRSVVSDIRESYCNHKVAKRLVRLPTLEDILYSS